jgi:hypothetical protein
MADLSKLVAQHLGSVPETGYGPIVLSRVTPGTRDPLNLTSGNNPTTQTYPCRGRLGTRSSTSIVGTSLVRTQTSVVVILRDSLPADVRPNVGDTVSRAGVVYRITEGGVTRGGSEVVYECSISTPGG